MKWTLTVTITSTGVTRTIDGNANDHDSALRCVADAARAAVRDTRDTDDLPTYILMIDDSPISILSAGRDVHGGPDCDALLAAIDQIESRRTV